MTFDDVTLYGRDDETDEYGEAGGYGESLEEDYEEEEEEEESGISGSEPVTLPGAAPPEPRPTPTGGGGGGEGKPAEGGQEESSGSEKVEWYAIQEQARKIRWQKIKWQEKEQQKGRPPPLSGVRPCNSSRSRLGAK